MLTVPQQLDECARRLLEAKGMAAKLRCLGQAVSAVKLWCDLAGRSGVARHLAHSAMDLGSLADGIKPPGDCGLRAKMGRRRG